MTFPLASQFHIYSTCVNAIKALVGAFSVIVKLWDGLFPALLGTCNMVIMNAGGNNQGRRLILFN